jgi:hypothetical protein
MSEENKTYHWDSGKGSRPRSYSVSQEEFGKNWDAIFGKKDNTCIKCPRDVEMRCNYCGLKQSDGSVNNPVAALSSEGQ